jgi:SOS response regulatory protein OraA/RecX
VNNADPALSEVINAGLRILNVAQNTEKQLRTKLIRKGYAAAHIDEAINYFKSKNYVNDGEFIERAAQRLADKKLYGKKRVELELYKMGFPRELIASLSYDELEIDFEANCAKALAKHPDTATLVRLGYTVSEIKKAGGTRMRSHRL